MWLTGRDLAGIRLERLAVGENTCALSICVLLSLFLFVLVYVLPLPYIYVFTLSNRSNRERIRERNAKDLARLLARLERWASVTDSNREDGRECWPARHTSISNRTNRTAGRRQKPRAGRRLRSTPVAVRSSLDITVFTDLARVTQVTESPTELTGVTGPSSPRKPGTSPSAS